MAAGPKHDAKNVRRGMVLVAVLTLLFLVLFVGPRAPQLVAARVQVYADFRTTTGLREGSPVQIAGARVGTVQAVAFVQVRYACDPLTEDVGRYGQGRTDSCDQDLFCSPMGYCAELEQYSGKGHHARCDHTADCAQDEICFTSEVGRRETHLMWSGPRGVCARFNTEHTRTRVRMEVPAKRVDLLRSDSRANIAANSVLGDQMVNISPGSGDELCPLTLEHVPDYTYDGCLANMRIQARPSLAEDIDRLRRRVDSFMEKADVSIVAVTELIDELRSEETMDDVRGIVNNVEVISRDVAYGEGLVGALLNSQQYRSEIALTLHALNRTASGFETTSRTLNGIGKTIDRNIDPLTHETAETLRAVDDVLAGLDHPDNRSIGAKLIRDGDGDIAKDLDRIFASTAGVTQSLANVTEAVDEGKGTLGLLINDDMVVDRIGKLLHNLARRDVLRGLALWYLESRKQLIKVPDARSPAKP